jgi:Nuclease-related domain
MKMIVLSRPDVCVRCNLPLAAGERAGWDPASRTTTCARCFAGETEPLARGRAGGSAGREYQRRSARHERAQRQRVAADREWRARVKTEHPVLGRVSTAFTPRVESQPEPDHVRSWAIGAPGEERVGEELDRIDGVVVLHDRRIRGQKSNIDHIAVCPAGVWLP